MWLFTKYGFFSATCARTGDGGYDNPPDVDRIMVRSRWHRHLVNLKTRFSEELSDLEIHASRNTDYRYRIFVAKAVWAKIVAALAEETDYDNFKNKAAECEKPDEGYHAALEEVWQVVYAHARRAIHPRSSS